MEKFNRGDKIYLDAEKNKLIADYMGFSDSDGMRTVNYDLIMPVVEKILNENKSCAYMGGKGYEDPERYFFSMLDDQLNSVANGSTNSLLEAIYDSVVEYLSNREVNTH
jgi:hypothetical protein